MTAPTASAAPDPEAVKAKQKATRVAGD